MSAVAARLARRLELDPAEFAYLEHLVELHEDGSTTAEATTRKRDSPPAQKSVGRRVLEKIREAR